jgi:hypothetical protein
MDWEFWAVVVVLAVLIAAKVFIFPGPASAARFGGSHSSAIIDARQGERKMTPDGFSERLEAVLCQAKARAERDKRWLPVAERLSWAKAYVPVAIPSAKDDAARRAYIKHTDSDPVVHSNRFPTWEELSENTRDEWRKRVGS